MVHPSRGADGIAIERGEARTLSLGVVLLLHTAAPGVEHRTPAPGVGDEPAKPRGEPLDVALAGEKTRDAVLDDLRDVAVPAAHDRHAGGGHLGERDRRPALRVAVVRGDARREE